MPTTDFYAPRQLGSGDRSLTIPPAPPIEEASDHPDVEFWTRKDWTNYYADAKLRNERLPKLGFLCDGSGKRLSDNQVQDIYDYAVVVWNQLYYARLDLKTWSKKTDKAAKYFSATMCSKFPEFCLCENDWKLEDFATLRYPDWNRYYRQSGNLTRRNPSMVKRKADTETEVKIPKLVKKRKTNEPPRPDQEIVDLESNGDIISSLAEKAPAAPALGPTSTSSSTSALLIMGDSTNQATDAPAPSILPANIPSLILPSTNANTPKPPTPDVNTSPNIGSVSAALPSDDNTAVASPVVQSSIAVPEGPRPTRPLRRRVNPLDGLSIPAPPSVVSASIEETSTEAVVPTKKRKGRALNVPEKIVSARQLYLVDYKKLHPDVTAAEFKKLYDKLDSATKERYNKLYKEMKRKPVPSSNDAAE